MYKRIVFTLASISLLASNWSYLLAAQIDGPHTNQGSPAEVLSRFDDSIDAIEELRTYIDRSQFDRTTLIEELDYDPDLILEFVKDNVLFEQYPGVLRGSIGTLLSRAGNAIDQSILLTSLLKDAGFDARIAAATLTQNQADLLLRQMSATRSEPPLFINIVELESMIEGVAKKSRLSAEAVKSLLEQTARGESSRVSKFVESVRKETDFLMNILSDEGIVLDASISHESLLNEATDYYYVEWRNGSSDKWRPAHPAVTGVAAFLQDLAPHSYFIESVPSDLQHRFRFEALITRKTLGKSESRLLFPAWEQPVANLIGSPVTYSHTSKNLVADEYLKSGTLGPAQSDIFVPVLNGKMVGDGFDIWGNSIPPDAAASMYAEVFQTVSNKLRSAVQAVFEMGSRNETDSREIQRITAVTLRYSLVAPSGETKQYNRTVFTEEEVDGDEFDYLRALQSLTRKYSISVGTGPLSKAYVLDKLLSDILERKQTLRAIVRHTLGLIDADELAADLSNGLSDPSWIGHGALDLIQATVQEEVRPALVYQRGPSIVSHYRELPLRDSAIEAIDIVTRSNIVLDLKTYSPLPNEQVFVGVWETYHEGLLIGHEGGEHFGAPATFELARSNKLDFIVVAPEQVDRLPRSSIPASVSKNIMADLKKGYTVVLPKLTGPVQDPRRIAWWRIDPRTGSTLGVAGTGEGQSATEWIVIGTAIFARLMTTCVGLHLALMESSTVGDAIGGCIGFVVPLASGGTAALATAAGLATGPIGMIFAAIAFLLKGATLIEPRPQP